jgi:ADP-ribose pyrophosphatase YjhB (NUDIX family)
VREELGIEIEVEERPVLMATHTYGPGGNWVLAISFLARIVDGEPSPADDAAGIRWISAEEIDGTDFAWEHYRTLVRAALEDGM